MSTGTKEIREAAVWELVDGTLMMSLPKDKVLALCDAADERDALAKELENVEYFLTQIDPVHFPNRGEARRRIAKIRQVLGFAPNTPEADDE